jgi:hypothetical protein
MQLFFRRHVRVGRAVHVGYFIFGRLVFVSRRAAWML